MKKQIYILAFICLMLVPASATAVSIQTPDSSITVYNDSTENVGITVFSQDFDCTDMFEDMLGDSGSYATHFQINFPPFTSYNYTWHSDKFRLKDLFSVFRSFKNSLRNSFPIMFQSRPFDMLKIGITFFFPILVILFIISCVIALSIIGKKAKDKEMEKRNHTDKCEHTRKAYESGKKSRYQKSDHMNEKQKKGLAVIICGVLLLLLSILLQRSWFISVGAFVLIIMGLVKYLTSLSDNSSKRP